MPIRSYQGKYFLIVLSSCWTCTVFISSTFAWIVKKTLVWRWIRWTLRFENTSKHCEFDIMAVFSTLRSKLVSSTVGLFRKRTSQVVVGKNNLLIFGWPLVSSNHFQRSFVLPRRSGNQTRNGWSWKAGNPYDSQWFSILQNPWYVSLVYLYINPVIRLDNTLL